MERCAGTSGHVLFLNWRDTRNPEGGGSEVYVERIAAELVARGFRATIFCAAHSQAPAEEVNDGGVRLVRRGGRHTVYLWAALCYVAGALGFGPLSGRRGGRPEVLVDVCNGLPFLAPLWARRPVVKLIHHVHREQWPVVLPPWAARFGWWVESSFAVRIYRRCRYVTVSEATRRELATLGVPPEQVSVVHNGTPELPRTDAQRAPFPLLVTLNRLVPHKRVEVALRAVAALGEELPQLRLVVAGQGWWESHLRELAAELEIAERVEFRGFVTEEEKAALLASAWVALTPSLKEGWGLTIVEAGSAGTPTVAFRDAGGVAEAVVDGRTGLLADDIDDYVAKVRTLLWEHEIRQGMGVEARQHAASFTWQAAGGRFAALVAGHGAPRPVQRRGEPSYLVP
ncbi:glycosyltransferase family 4 protein [Micromonospora phytophila]|uniref:glycosyltransferase family 4 protein n=1 Tax=Micromonospora phytophila TaxID=709888 RepID=UPI00202E6F6C|nr:glycosyltransferase family 4 protein [Micromonospora phytophila]MCM0674914.1 glycosyltransferase family 4 protein [Micromonospora phytophila]